MRRVFELAGKITVDGLAAVEKGLSRIDGQVAAADKALTKFGRQATKIGTTLTKDLTAPIIAVGAGILALSVRTGDYAEKLQNLSKQTGLSTDTLQEFKYAADIAGVGFEGLAKGVNQFTRRLPQIVKEGGAAYNYLKQLGVSVFDSSGRVRDMNELFPEMIRALQGVDNAAERAAIAQQIFGREINDIGPIIGMSADELDKLRKAAHENGLVMSSESVESAAAFGDQIDELKAQLEGAFRNIAMQFIPILRDTFVPFVKGTLVPAMQSLAVKIKELATWFSELDAGTKQNILNFVAFLAVVGPVFLGVGKLIAIMKSLAVTVALIRTAMTGLTIAMATNPFTAAIVGAGLLATALIGLTTAYDSFNKSRKKHAETVKDEGVELKELRKDWQDELLWLEAQEKPTSSMISRMGDLRDGIAQISESLGGLQEKKIDVNLGSDKEADRIKEVARLNQEWADKLAAMTENKIETNDREYKSAVAAAQKIGAETTRITQYYTLQREQIQGDEAKTRQEKYKKEIQEAKDKARDIADIESGWHRKTLEQSGDRVGVLELERDEALRVAREKGASIADIEKYYQKAIRDEQDKTKENSRKNVLETVGQWVGKFGQVASEIGGIFQSITEGRINQNEKWYANEKAAIEKSTGSEAQKKKKFEALDKQYNEKRTALQREAAKKSKAIAIFDAIVGTGAAVISMLKEKPPLNFVMAGIVGAIGAVKTALIAAQPLPLAAGGLVKRREGGILGQIAEGREDEMIMPMKTGVRVFVDDILNRLGNIRLPAMQMAGAVAGAGGYGREVHWHIGTLVADDRGILELERKQRQFRISEDQRRGAE